MRIEEIKVGELEELLASSLFRDSKNIPISPLRAIAQKNNPRANPEDIALLIAVDKSNQVLSYVGCLPDRIAQHPVEKIAWNSCWWRHPEKGKRIALPLLLRAIQLWEGRLLFDDLPEHSKQILEKLGGFAFREMEGVRCFLRFKFYKILQRKTGLKPLAFLAKGMDLILNASWSNMNVFLWRSAQEKSKLRLEKLTRIDEETGKWIAAHAQKELIQRGARELNWILDYPWMSTNKLDKSTLVQKYFFSTTATIFENHVFQVFEKESLIAFLFFTNRDRQVKLPYVYFEKDKLQAIVKLILKILIELKAESFVCFQKEICEVLHQEKTPFFYQKKIIKTFGIAKKLEKHLDQTQIIQDGDGDWVFT